MGIFTKRSDGISRLELLVFRINIYLVTQSSSRTHAVKLLHTLLLKTTVFAFNVLPLGSYAPMPAPSLPFKTILELVLWN